MADVFISYSSEDRERVAPLARALEARGLKVWWDRALAAGDDYSAVIRKALDASKAAIVVWSRNSVESPWVRDEAARARDLKRLVPILLDRVEIPLGFGAINAEDFTAWNGQPQAAQVELLYEALKARIEGRAPDGAALIAKRKRLMGRIRLVSLLSATAAGVAIVAGVLNIIDRQKEPPPAQVVEQDSLSQLLQLVNEGKITGDQAVALAKLLETQAFADLPPEPAAAAGEGEAVASEQAALRSAAGAPEALSADAAPASSETPVELASVSEQELRENARATFSDAAAALIQDPDPRVRAAAIEASRPETRKAGLDAMWKMAEEGGGSSGAMWRFVSALSVVTDDPRAGEALEKAKAANPQDRRLWKMLSVAYQRDDSAKAAQGAALLGEGLEAAAAGQTEQAAQTLEKALPLLPKADSRAFVLGQLGDAAAKRDDWSAAEQRYKQAVDLHAANKDVAALSLDAAKLARALVQQGETRRACASLQRAKRMGAEAIEPQMTETCAAAEAPKPEPERAPVLLKPAPLRLAPAAPPPG